MKISHRYPVNAAGNDIDRAWLVDQLPTAKRPNALLEIALSPLPVVRIAAQTWVHVDTLIDFVLGDDDLTPFELGSLSGALDILNVGDMSDYLSREDLFEDPDFETGFDVDAVLAGADDSDPAAPLIRKLLTLTPPPVSATQAVGLRYDMQNDEIRIDYHCKPRQNRITRRRRQHGTATI